MKILLIAFMVVFGVLTSTYSEAQEADFSPENRTEVSLSDLPTIVKNTLDTKEYDGWKIVGIFQSNQYDSRGPNARYLIRLQYEVEFKDVYVDGAGLAYDPNM